MHTRSRSLENRRHPRPNAATVAWLTLANPTAFPGGGRPFDTLIPGAVAVTSTAVVKAQTLSKKVSYPFVCGMKIVHNGDGHG